MGMGGMGMSGAGFGGSGTAKRERRRGRVGPLPHTLTHARRNGEARVDGNNNYLANKMPRQKTKFSLCRRGWVVPLAPSPRTHPTKRERRRGWVVPLSSTPASTRRSGSSGECGLYLAPLPSHAYGDTGKREGQGRCPFPLPPQAHGEAGAVASAGSAGKYFSELSFTGASEPSKQLSRRATTQATIMVLFCFNPLIPISHVNKDKEQLILK
jgi:hypothetical protein